MAQALHPSFAYIGCNTVNPGARKTGNGNGISVYGIDRGTQAWTLVQVCAGIPNPGFLTINRDATFLYSAHGDHPEVSAYSIDRKTGQLTFLNLQRTDGPNPQHLAIDSANRYIVLDKATGVTVFPINDDGSLARFCDNFEPAHGPDSPRGDIAPCTHQIAFDPSGRFVIVPDRNLDKIHVYKFDAASGRLTGNDPPSVASRPWAGPRHIAFHPSASFAYVVNETDSTVTAHRWNASRGVLDPFQVIAATPAGFSDENTGAEIAVSPSGKFVYASNRGHDSIAIFSVDPADGALELVGWESTQGKTPRFFTLDSSGGMLYAANQDSDSIVFFSVDEKSGKLTATGQRVETGTPTCIAFSYR